MKIVKIKKKIFFSEISKEVINIFNYKKKIINIFLTGGVSAKNLYKSISKNSNKINIFSKVNIFQTDERIYERKQNKNSENISKNLINKIKNKKMNFFPMKVNSNKFINKSTYYNCFENHMIDLIVLTLGNDGHIASLSSEDSNIYSNKKICYTKYNSKLINRLSIGPKFLTKARKIYVISNGKKKIEMYKILENQNKYYKKINKILNKAKFFID